MKTSCQCTITVIDIYRRFGALHLDDSFRQVIFISLYDCDPAIIDTGIEEGIEGIWQDSARTLPGLCRFDRSPIPAGL